MSDSDSMMLNRLVVLLQIILIPAYFVYFTVEWREEIQLFFDLLLSRNQWLRPALPNWMVTFLITFGITIFFSLPWVIPSIMRATKIADAYTLMGRALGKVRIDQKLFYGLNAAFTLVFFILPFGSPLITIIGIFVVVRMVLRKLLIGRLSKLIWFIPGLIIAFYPGLIATAFYSNYFVLMDKILETWTYYIGIIFGIGLCLAISISMGNFIHFLFEGRKKYEKVEINEGFVLIFKTLIFGILLLMYFNDGSNIVDGINYIAVALAFVEIVGRRIKDVNVDQNSAKGVIMVIVFSLVNMVIRYLESVGRSPVLVQSIVIVISGLIFFGLFSLSYKYAEDPELIDM